MTAPRKRPAGRFAAAGLLSDEPGTVLSPQLRFTPPSIGKPAGSWPKYKRSNVRGDDEADAIDLVKRIMEDRGDGDCLPRYPLIGRLRALIPEEGGRTAALARVRPRSPDLRNGGRRCWRASTFTPPSWSSRVN